MNINKITQPRTGVFPFPYHNCTIHNDNNTSAKRHTTLSYFQLMKKVKYKNSITVLHKKRGTRNGRE
jgi:hypothetical protein